MKKLNTFWNSFQRSLLDFTYYKDIVKASYWFSFKYLLFLLVCLSVVKSVQLGVEYSKVKNKIPTYISSARRELLALYPAELELRISNGKLYTNVAEPYYIEFPKVLGSMQGKHLAVIDTKGIADNYPEYNTLILATRQALVYPDKQRSGNATTTQVYYFSQLKRSLYIDHTVYTRIIHTMDPFIAKLPMYIDRVVLVGLILLPFVGGLLWTSATLFGLVFLTIIIWIIEKIMKTQYGYKTLFRFGMHGVTWSILFTFLLSLTNQTIPHLYNLIFGIWMTIVLFNLKKEYQQV